jgi:hypothetical protein
VRNKSGKEIMMKSKKFFIIDAAILLGFLAAEQPHMTGISIHEWLSVALAGTLIVHLLLHWKWIVGVAATFFKKLWNKSRLQFILDGLLLVDFGAIMTSGLMMSRSFLPALGIQVANSQSARMLHSFSASAAILLVVVHVVLNWKWIVNTTKRLVMPSGFVVAPKARQVAPLQVNINKD